MGIESFGRKSVEPAAEIEDYKDAPELYALLAQLPRELRQVHLAHIEKLGDDEAMEYLQGVTEKREAAIRESVVSDPSIQNYFNEHGEQIWKSLETDIYSDTNNYLGAGQTAKVKHFALQDAADLPIDSLAVKYLVNPTKNTLSVSGEHDLILEVERIQKIEKARDSVDPSLGLSVPHPYFYYRNKAIQCYGMEEIDGINLEEDFARADIRNPAIIASLQEVLRTIDSEKLFEEFDRFFDTMHEICLHNDVKPANMMVSRSGRFYLIDFGQSAPASHVDEKSVPAFQAHADSEKQQARLAASEFLKRLRDYTPEDALQQEAA